MSELPPSNDDLQAAYTPEQLRENINRRKGDIYRLETGLGVLRNSPTPTDPFIIGRIKHAESTIADYQKAIEQWELFLAKIEGGK